MSSSKSGGSSQAATKRLVKELSSYPSDPNPCLRRLGPVEEGNILAWEAVMIGPDDSPYEGGKWRLDIKIPSTYPLAPPTVIFTTKIIHPNISFKDGSICLDLLTKKAWTPAYTISETLSAINQMLLYPETDSPLNVDAAVICRTDTVGWESLVRWGCGEWRS